MTWSSGADLEATKRGSHGLRQAGRSCSLIGAPRAHPFDQVVLGLGATSLRKLSRQGQSATVQGVPVPRAAAQKDAAPGRFDSFATPSVYGRYLRVAVDPRQRVFELASRRRGPHPDFRLTFAVFGIAEKLLLRAQILASFPAAGAASNLPKDHPLHL